MLSNKWIISMISTKYLFNSGTSLWFNRTWMNGLKKTSLSQGLLLCLTLSFSLGDGIYLQQKSKAFFLLFFIFLIPLAVNQQVFNWAQYESISIWNFKVTDHQVQISSQCFSSHHIIFFFFFTKFYPASAWQKLLSEETPSMLNQLFEKVLCGVRTFSPHGPYPIGLSTTVSCCNAFIFSRIILPKTS